MKGGPMSWERKSPTSQPQHASLRERGLHVWQSCLGNVGPSLADQKRRRARMQKMGLVAGVAMAIGVHATSAASQSVATTTPQPSNNDKKEVTISGCVVKGDGGYVLMNVAEETAAAAVAAGTPSSPQPPGTVMPGRVLYWLDDDDDLQKHAGQKVEVRGELEGDVGRGKISAEREGGLVELEFKVPGEKKVTVMVPSVPPTAGTTGTVGDKEPATPYLARRSAGGSAKT